MTNARRTSEWVVLAGVALLVIGAWALVDRVFAWVFYPVSLILHALGTVGWPLLAVGVGVLLIMRGRSGGWATNGTLARSRTDRRIGGVLGGAAVYLGLDSNVVRAVFAVATVLTGFWFGFFVYAIALLVIPEQQFAYASDQRVPSAPSVPSPPNASSAV